MRLVTLSRITDLLPANAISAKVVNKRKIAGYYSMEDDLINAGAIYTDEPAVVDKNIITISIKSKINFL